MKFGVDQRRMILNLARAAICRTLQAREHFVGSISTDTPVGRLPGSSNLLPTDDPAFLHELAGCFVSLHRCGSHQLRGCVGRLDAAEPLRASVQASAASVLDDPRFAADPVRLEELPELELEVSVLSALRDVPHPLDFDPLNDGIYLTCGSRSGCFLPQVARETGWGREQLLERLCTEKMGLLPNAWRGFDARMSVFSTVTVGPEPFMQADSINSDYSDVARPDLRGIGET